MFWGYDPETGEDACSEEFEAQCACFAALSDEELCALLLDTHWTPCVDEIDASSQCMDTHNNRVKNDSAPYAQYAIDLCEDYAKEPAETALTDLTGCEWSAPTRRSPIMVGSEVDCTYFPGSGTGNDDDDGNDDDPVCFGMDVPTPGGSESGDSTDSESEEDEIEDPFGELEVLVDCEAAPSPGRHCVVDEALVHGAVERFQVFYDEGVRLEVVDAPGLGVGVQISGLDPGEGFESAVRHVRNPES